MDELMSEPGANRSMMEATSEKSEMLSCLSEEPMATEEEIQAGAPISPVRPSLPLAMTVAMPSERRVSVARWSSPADGSQYALAAPPARRMLTDARLWLWRRNPLTQSRAASWSSVKGMQQDARPLQ